MGITIDFLRGVIRVYVTCDNCGLPILGPASVDEPSPDSLQDYERYTHPNGCPGREDVGLAEVLPRDDD